MDPKSERDFGINAVDAAKVRGGVLELDAALELRAQGGPDHNCSGRPVHVAVIFEARTGDGVVYVRAGGQGAEPQQGSCHD